MELFKRAFKSSFSLSSSPELKCDELRRHLLALVTSLDRPACSIRSFNFLIKTFRDVSVTGPAGNPYSASLCLNSLSDKFSTDAIFNKSSQSINLK
jgi:hypothetical protein